MRGVARESSVRAGLMALNEQGVTARRALQRSTVPDVAREVLVPLAAGARSDQMPAMSSAWQPAQRDGRGVADGRWRMKT